MAFNYTTEKCIVECREYKEPVRFYVNDKIKVMLLEEKIKQCPGLKSYIKDGWLYGRIEKIDTTMNEVTLDISVPCFALKFTFEAHLDVEEIELIERANLKGE